MRWIDTAQPTLQCQAIDAQFCRRLTITFVGFYPVPAQRIQNVFRSHGIATFSSLVWSLSIQAKFPPSSFSGRYETQLVLCHLAFRCSRCLSSNEKRNWGSNRSVPVSRVPKAGSESAGCGSALRKVMTWTFSWSFASSIPVVTRCSSPASTATNEMLCSRRAPLCS